MLRIDYSLLYEIRSSNDAIQTNIAARVIDLSENRLPKFLFTLHFLTALFPIFQLDASACTPH